MRAKQSRRTVLVAVSTVVACSWIAACGESNTPTVVADEVVENDLVTAGQTVRVEARVDGDVAAAGADVTFSGPVSGYIMGAGRRVSINAPVENDVWAAGERVTIGSRVGDNAMLAGQTVRLTPEATIGHNARLAGAEVTSEGRVVNNLTIAAGRAVIGGEVGGAVRANAERVTVLPGTVVRGDLIVRSPAPPEVSPQAQVLGNVDYQSTEGDSSGWFSWPLVWAGLFLSLLVLSLGALLVAPAWSERVTGTLRARPLASGLAGLILLIAVPVVILVLLITMIGIPLAVVLVAVYVGALVLSAAFVSYQLGRWLFERANRGVSRWAAIAVGALIVSLGLSLPILGPLVAFIVVIMGAGALAMEWIDRRRQLQPT